MKITIENCKCPSWNEFNRSVHWAVRAAKRQELQDFVYEAITKQFKGSFRRITAQIKKPIQVSIEAHFKNNHRRDPDNLFVKPFLDAMVKVGLFYDDNGDVIESLTLSAKRNMPSDKIIISINEKL
ncbi:MAG: hypothetical protein WCI36_02970 [bacterium]